MFLLNIPQLEKKKVSQGTLKSLMKCPLLRNVFATFGGKVIGYEPK